MSTSTSLHPIDEENPTMELQPQVSIPIPQPQTQSLPPNLPRGDLLTGSRENYVKIGVPLYEASIKGLWEDAKAILDLHPELIRSGITENCETPLHIAASAKSTTAVEVFVKNLVGLMEKKDLELQNKSHNTALCLAAAAGNVRIAKIMVKKNSTLLDIPGSQGMMPLYMAVLFGKHDMVKYLYQNSKKMAGDFWTDLNRGWVLQKCVEADIFDVALKIVNDRNELASKRSVVGHVLLALAQKTDALSGKRRHIIWRIIKSIFAFFHLKVGPVDKESEALQLLKVIWKNIAVMNKGEIDDILRGQRDFPKQDEKPTSEKEDQSLQILKLIYENMVKMPVESHNIIRGPTTTTSNATKATACGNAKPKYPSRILFVAAKMGNTRFIVELIRQYPDLIWKVNDNNQSIFHMAVKHRHVGVYNLLYEIGSMKDLITPLKDKNGNNMLHLVGKSYKEKKFQTVSGVALQMQRELLWFEEVKQMIPLDYRERKNKTGKTPHELFTERHKDLVNQGEVWMKNTASQCMVVATLIATIVFAAAFTLPGGYDQDKGIPIFVHKRAFLVFVIADAISLIFSSSSILMFLSILTSRYAERDFMESLPRKLIFGLGTLFLSVVTMMVAFSASFFILYHKSLKWIPIMIIGCAATPVILFAILQFRLLADVFYSTYRSRYLFKPKKKMLYY